MLLPFFSPGRIKQLEPFVEQLADRLIDGFAGATGCDGARDYAQHIPVQVIATVLGIPLTTGIDSGSGCTTCSKWPLPTSMLPSPPFSTSPGTYRSTSSVDGWSPVTTS
jgi:hypothetical protein